ncbi:MAG: MerR family transcriptional regulator [Saprospiraceae bacterium]|nr:MerR family transcriptional regulator [Saprospiraceae bacterium]
MKEYTVKQLAKLAGVSVRSLHHYDKIGLLKPSRRSEKNYRFYGPNELLLLQQILFYKMLDFDLTTISEIIHARDFDLLAALKDHKRALEKRQKQTKTLLQTIEKTIHQLQKENMMLTDKELYEGFTPEDVQAIKTEVKGRWGEKELTETENRIRAMGQEGWKDQKEKQEALNKGLADLMELEPNHPTVQQAIYEHHQLMNAYYEVDETRYRGLADMYMQDDRFKAHYDNYRNGLAEFLCEAIHVYCDQNFKNGSKKTL